LGSKDDFVMCPRCRKLGSLRLKDKRYNSLVVYHYDNQKYQHAGKGDKTCYIGRISKLSRDPKTKATAIERAKIKSLKFTDQISHLFEENNTDLLQNTVEKQAFIDNLVTFEQRIRKQKSEKFTIDQNLTYFTSILNELRRIRKNLGKKRKIIERKLEWNIPCIYCKKEMRIGALFRGVDSKRGIRMYYGKKLDDLS